MVVSRNRSRNTLMRSGAAARNKVQLSARSEHCSIIVCLSNTLLLRLRCFATEDEIYILRINDLSYRRNPTYR